MPYINPLTNLARSLSGWLLDRVGASLPLAQRNVGNRSQPYHPPLIDRRIIEIDFPVEALVGWVALK